MLLNVNRAKSSSPIATADEWNPYATAEVAPERERVSPKEFVAAMTAGVINVQEAPPWQIAPERFAPAKPTSN